MLEHVQVQNFVQSHDSLKDYRIDYADYWPAKYERMGDYSSNKSKAIEKLYLTFLQSKTSNSIHSPRPAYRAPDTDVLNKTRAYNELKVQDTQHRAKNGVLPQYTEKILCWRDECVMSLFAGAKFTCAAMVCVI